MKYLVIGVWTGDDGNPCTSSHATDETNPNKLSKLLGDNFPPGGSPATILLVESTPTYPKVIQSWTLSDEDYI